MDRRERVEPKLEQQKMKSEVDIASRAAGGI